jgi:hypothetical protein
MADAGSMSNEEFARRLGPEPSPDDGYWEEGYPIPMPDYHREESAAMSKYLWPSKEVADAVLDRYSELLAHFRGHRQADGAQRSSPRNPRCRTSPRSTSKAK